MYVIFVVLQLEVWTQKRHVTAFLFVYTCYVTFVVCDMFCIIFSFYININFLYNNVCMTIVFVINKSIDQINE